MSDMFKVGNTIEVLGHNPNEKEYVNWPDDMDETVGLIGEILEVEHGYNESDVRYYIELENGMIWWYQQNWIQLYKEEIVPLDIGELY